MIGVDAAIQLRRYGFGQPSGALAEQMTRDFGDFSRFRGELIGAAATIMGSGWAALVWDPVSKRLMTTQIHDHQSQITQGGVPILVLDAWEHAYYLQYQNRKAEFFTAVWNVWNWADVAARYTQSLRSDMNLKGSAR